MKLLLALVLLPLFVVGQNIDTTKLKLASKIKLICLIDPMERADYYNIFIERYNPNIEFLRSEGFESNHVFFRIHVRDTTMVFDTVTKGSFVDITYRSFFSHINGDVYFAYNTFNEEIFAIAGLTHNDLAIFMYFLEKRTQNFSLRHQAKYMYIEGLDLKCLINHMTPLKRQGCLKVAESYYIRTSFSD